MSKADMPFSTGTMQSIGIHGQHFFMKCAAELRYEYTTELLLLLLLCILQKFLTNSRLCVLGMGFT